MVLQHELKGNATPEAPACLLKPAVIAEHVAFVSVERAKRLVCSVAALAAAAAASPAHFCKQMSSRKGQAF